MSRKPTDSRRRFLRNGVAAGTLATLPGLARASAQEGKNEKGTGARARDGGLKVGVATYSFSKLPLDATLRGLARVGARYASVKSAHLPLDSTPQERKDVARKFLDAGVILLSCGVVTLKDDASEQRHAFEYARDAGIPTLVCNPTPGSLPNLDRLAREFDIKVAIHNHGPEDKVWPSPDTVWDAVQGLDPRVGLCIDVGHTARAGVDPAAAIRKCAVRLHDVHVKDLAGLGLAERPEEIGRGVLDIHAILAALRAVKFGGHVGVEYEKDLNDPLPGVAESLGFVRGQLAEMGRA